MKIAHCVQVTGDMQNITVLLYTSCDWPYNACNIAYVTVKAISLGDAAKQAIENYSYDCKPIVKAFYLN